MNTASLELCHELYQLSGWGEYGQAEVKGFANVISYNYTAGFLLRKLPRHLVKKRSYHLTIMNGNMNNDSWIADYFSLTGDAWYTVDVLKLEAQLSEAETPENALAQLCILLIKQGIINPQEAQNGDSK